MLVPNRHKSADSYRYGFQGQEKDDEIRGGEGNSLNYDFRVHDPRIGRFFATDPLEPEYPSISPFAFGENRVIDMVELEGLEAAKTEDKKGDESTKADGPQKTNDTFLDGWNRKVYNYNSNFQNGVDNFFREPVKTSLDGTYNLLNGISLLVGDCIPGLTQAMGVENRTANAMVDFGNTVWNIPNMSKSQTGEFTASASIFMLELSASKRLPVSTFAAQLEFQVGEYAALRKIAINTGLDAHHAGQAAIMKKLINKYDPATAPAILVNKIGHTVKKPYLGILKRSTKDFNYKAIRPVRNLVARDALELRRVYKVPNVKIKELIDLNKSKYPKYFEKPPRK